MTQNNKLEIASVKPDISFLHLETMYRLLDFEDELKLDTQILDIRKYMENTNGVGKTSEQKDDDYANAQLMWKAYQQNLRDFKFNFYLDRDQYNLLTDILLKKLEYDVNTLFIAIELTNLLGGMNGTKFNDSTEIKSFRANATEVTYIYHLIQNYKVKGLTKESYTFSKILIKIGDISKIVSYYDSNAKNLTDEITKWAFSLENVPQQIIPDLPVESTEVK